MWSDVYMDEVGRSIEDKCFYKNWANILNFSSLPCLHCTKWLLGKWVYPLKTKLAVCV